MNDEVLDTVEDEEGQLSRRGLLVKGGLAAAGLTMLGSPAAAAFGATKAGSIKAAVDARPRYEAHGGPTEDVAGKGAGKQFKAAGAKKVLVVIHEASNSGLTERAAGVKSVLGGAGVKVLTIPNAKSDIPGTKAKIQAAFKADKSLDGFLGLDPDVTIPALDVLPKGTKAGTFDVGGSIKEIKAGRMLFAIDQQQYLQGYLPVVFAVLFVTNLNTVGNGAPVLTGPGIINKKNAAQVAELAAKGTR